MPQENTQLRERERTNIQEPHQYSVVMHNDDVTTMEFVVRVLTTVFFKNHSDAEKLMMTIHLSGKAVVGVYSHDIACSKVHKANQMAQKEGFPLKITIERN